MRRYEIATAAGLLAVAVLVMLDSRESALIASTARYPGGIGPGFYPFWAAAVMAGACVVIIVRARVPALVPSRAFENRTALVSMVAVVGPLVIAAVTMTWLGFYIVCGLYTAFFARFIGRYRWAWAVLIGLLFPVVTYLAFEIGFRVRLPKSTFYEMGLLF